MRSYQFIFITIILCLFSCAQNADNKTTETPATTEAKEVVPQEKIYQMVDEMPRFPGCENLVGDARNGCSGTKIFEFIKEKLQYPTEAKDAGKEGRAVISFVIDKTGEIEDIKIKQDPGFGMGAEAQRIVASFPTWIPGKHEGKAVKVAFNLPVKFQLKD